MALSIKDAQVERLAREVAAMSGESKTGAIRTALRERKDRLALARAGADREQSLRALLENEIWPSLPPGLVGRAPSSEEQEQSLGYGREGL